MPKRQQKAHVVRYTAGQYHRLPADVVKSDAYRALSFSARALLVDMLLQFRGNNNGNLTLAHKIMEPLGWAKSTLLRARKELEDSLLIEVTRPGGRHRCTLYRLSFISQQKHGFTEYPSDAWRNFKKNPLVPKRHHIGTKLTPPIDIKRGKWSHGGTKMTPVRSIFQQKVVPN